VPSTEKLGAEPFGFQADAVMRKDLAAVAAMRAHEVADILDHAEHRHVEFVNILRPQMPAT
jgi:hypothetical protein